MPPLSKHQSGSSTKMLLLGDSGAGKTGALASLAQAGYNIRILDLDSGVDVLRNLLGDNAAANVESVTLTDPMKPVAGKLVPGAATVWSRAINLLSKWEYEYVLDKSGTSRVLWTGKDKTDAGADPTRATVSLGGVASWGPQDVLVVDSLTMLSNAALAFVLSLNGRLGQQAHQSDWFQGQQLIEGLLQMLYDENVRCNVIVNCHLTYIGEEGAGQRAYPNCLGKALPPKVGRYFNTALLVQGSGQGANVKRKIYTNTRGLVELKNTAPTKVAPDYDLATGLADYFKAVRS